MREHLDRDRGDDADLLDPDDAVRGRAAPRPRAATSGTAAAGSARGRRGGCARTEPERLPVLTRLWAVPVYRLVYDPDGRSVRDRLRNAGDARRRVLNVDRR